jgi:hypothetical protein
MATDKKPKIKPKTKPVPPDAVVKGPNRRVAVKKLPSDCAN